MPSPRSPNLPAQSSGRIEPPLLPRVVGVRAHLGESRLRTGGSYPLASKRGPDPCGRLAIQARFPRRAGCSGAAKQNRPPWGSQGPPRRGRGPPAYADGGSAAIGDRGEGRSPAALLAFQRRLDSQAGLRFRPPIRCAAWVGHYRGGRPFEEYRKASYTKGERRAGRCPAAIKRSRALAASAPSLFPGNAPLAAAERPLP